MGANFKNVEQERQCILNYLKDMFGSTFDEDIIESVLEQRNWNVDRTVDDLMTMTSGNTFEIPVEEIEIRNVDPISDPRSQNSGNLEINPSLLLPDQSTVCNDTKINNDDDGIVILDEEEYVVPTESDDNESVGSENYQPPQRPSSRPTSSLPTGSYALMAQKPASANATRASTEHIVRAKPPLIIYQGYTSYDRIKRARDSVERVKLYVQNCFKIMVILRGCPGSGKSTLAKRILQECNINNNPFMHIHSTDNFFYLKGRGRYQIELDELPKAHHWNTVNVLHVVREGLTPIIVDNTNTQIWEMEKYASMAVCAGYEIEVIEPDTPWVFSIHQLVSRNSHKVPKERLFNMLDRYEHNVSATTLLKHFHLKYSPELLPPQNGVRTLKNPTVVSTFDHIYHAICVLRENVQQYNADTVAVTKAEKKRERRKRRKIIEEEVAAAAAFVELDELTETDSANSVNDTENDNVTAGEEEEEVKGGKEGSDSDPSWVTMDDDELTESRTSEGDEEENKACLTNSDAQSESLENKINGAAEIDAVPDDYVQVQPFEETMSVDEKLADLKPVVVDEFRNPFNVVDEGETIALSTNIMDVEVSGSRLKCFEKLWDDGRKEEGLESCMNQVMNNVLSIISDGEVKEDHVVTTKSLSRVLNNTLTSDITEADLELSQLTTVDSVASESISKSVDCLRSTELVVSKNSEDNSHSIMSSAITKIPSPVEIYLDCSSKLVDKPSDLKNAHEVSDPEVSPNKSDRVPEKQTDNIYNASTRDRKLKQCNVEGQKNTLVDTVCDTPCSFKFKEDLTKNVIANDLWGKVNENEVDVEKNLVAGEEKELSDDNSDNMESRSNSSSSDDMAITDVHNTSNRFVNNDIKNEQSERKKPNINHKKKNQNVADDVVENVWNMAEPAVPELNTLKERILINSLDKVFNQNQNFEFPLENTSAVSSTVANDVKPTKLPQRRSTATTSFHIIENKLKDEYREACSPSSSRSEDFEDAIDSSESRLLNQWMRGENWDEGAKDMPEMKKNESDIKPQRKVLDSPPKQKNRETAPNIRLVNDIRNVSDNSKMSLLLDKKIRNQDSVSQPLKSTNFQSQFWLDRSSPHSLNTMQHVSSKEDDIESDFEAKSKSFRTFEDQSFESQRNNVFSRSYPSPFKNFDANESQFWPGSLDSANTIWGNTSVEGSQWNQINNKASPEFLDSLIARHRFIASDDNSSDFEKSILKWSPFNDTAKNKIDEIVIPAPSDNSYFVPVEIMNQERNKATNTGLDESAGAAIIKIGRCREINQGRSSPDRSIIESSYKCDKSTMADGSSYTLKAKPLKEDLVNIFPIELVDVILDLYDKCNGNMDWIIEILMEDGHSPSDDQLEYLSSLQNMVVYELWEENSAKEKPEKDKKVSDKKKNRGKNNKIGRGGSNSQIGDGRKKIEPCSSATDFNDHNPTEGTDLVSEEHVDLFFDWCTVSQLLEYFGNPTIYSIGDYQPTVKLPISLARQLHAYLIGSIIDQAEENEDLINQLSEEDYSINNYIQNSSVEEFSQKDLTEVENSLSDFLQDPFVDLSGRGTGEGAEGSSVKVVRHKDSFASKLSLNLLLKAFPTLDSSFIKSTFKSQNFNYYDTKNVLNQYGKEVPIDAPSNSPLNEQDSFENDDDIQFFGNNSNVANTGSEVLKQVTEFRKNASINRCQWQKCHESLRTAVQEKKFGVAAYYRDIMNVFRKKYEEYNAHAAAVLINSCCLQNSDMIDLHYFKVTDALKALDKFLDDHIRKLLFSGRSRMTLYIITGRGARSVNGVSRIQPSVKNRLKRRNISFEVESYNTGLVKAIIRKNSLMSNSL